MLIFRLINDWTYHLLLYSWVGELAFNVVFTFIFTRQKITPYILNSLVLLTLSAILLWVNLDSDRPKGVNTAKYIVGFICTVATSAIYGLLPPLMQVVFNRVIKKETFASPSNSKSILRPRSTNSKGKVDRTCGGAERVKTNRLRATALRYGLYICCLRNSLPCSLSIGTLTNSISHIQSQGLGQSWRQSLY